MVPSSEVLYYTSYGLINSRSMITSRYEFISITFDKITRCDGHIILKIVTPVSSSEFEVAVAALNLYREPLGVIAFEDFSIHFPAIFIAGKHSK